MRERQVVGRAHAIRHRADHRGYGRSTGSALSGSALSGSALSGSALSGSALSGSGRAWGVFFRARVPPGHAAQRRSGTGSLPRAEKHTPRAPFGTAFWVELRVPPGHAAQRRSGTGSLPRAEKHTPRAAYETAVYGKREPHWARLALSPNWRRAGWWAPRTACRGNAMPALGGGATRGKIAPLLRI